MSEKYISDQSDYLLISPCHSLLNSYNSNCHCHNHCNIISQYIPTENRISSNPSKLTYELITKNNYTSNPIRNINLPRNRTPDSYRNINEKNVLNCDNKENLDYQNNNKLNYQNLKRYNTQSLNFNKQKINKGKKKPVKNINTDIDKQFLIQKINNKKLKYHHIKNKPNQIKNSSKKIKHQIKEKPSDNKLFNISELINERKDNNNKSPYNIDIKPNNEHYLSNKPSSKFRNYYRGIMNPNQYYYIDDYRNNRNFISCNNNTKANKKCTYELNYLNLTKINEINKKKINEGKNKFKNYISNLENESEEKDNNNRMLTEFVYSNKKNNDNNYYKEIFHRNNNLNSDDNSDDINQNKKRGYSCSEYNKRINYQTKNIEDNKTEDNDKIKLNIDISYSDEKCIKDNNKSLNDSQNNPDEVNQETTSIHKSIKNLKSKIKYKSPTLISKEECPEKFKELQSKYQKVLSEIKNYKNNQLKYNSLLVENEKMQSELDQLKTLSTEAKSNYENLAKKYNELVDDYNTLQKVYCNLKHENKELQKCNTKLNDNENNCKNLTEHLEKVKKKFQDLECKYMNLKQIKDEQDNQIEFNIKEIRELKNEIRDLKNENCDLNQLYKNCIKESKLLKNELCEKNRKQISQYENTIKRLNDEIGQYKKEIAELKRKNDKNQYEDEIIIINKETTYSKGYNDSDENNKDQGTFKSRFHVSTKNDLDKGVYMKYHEIIQDLSNMILLYENIYFKNDVKPQNTQELLGFLIFNIIEKKVKKVRLNAMINILLYNQLLISKRIKRSWS